MARPKKKRPASKPPPVKKQHGGRRKGAGRPRAPRFLDDFAQVGAPPADPLRATEWGMQLLTVALDKVRLDPNMTERDRRTEMKSLLRHMKDLVPAARISAAERIILAAEQRRTAPAEPVRGSEELEDAAPFAEPIRAGGD